MNVPLTRDSAQGESSGDTDDAGEIEYRERTRKSSRYHGKAKAITPGGVSANLKFFRPYPITMARGAGAYLWDVDGNRYIDYQLCYGTLILGHGDPAVVNAIVHQAREDGTTAFGAPHRREIEMAETLLHIFPAAEQVRFTNSGLEATLLSVRLALAFTKRRRIAKFEGHYHGAHERVLVSYHPVVSEAGDARAPRSIPDSMEIPASVLGDTLVLPFNDWDATEVLIRAHATELACVLLEPIQGGFIAPEDGFLEKLSGLTRSLGILLVFDEVKTGFRASLGGAQALYNVAPDITTLGKILGGGFPAGAVIGRRDILSVLDPSPRGRGTIVFHSGTHNGHPTALAAGLATLDELTVPSTYERLRSVTDELKARILAIARARGIPLELPGVESVFGVAFSSVPIRSYRDMALADTRRRRLLDLRLLAQGIYPTHGDRFSLSVRHSLDDVEQTVRAFEAALTA